jgi:hypothetical protein
MNGNKKNTLEEKYDIQYNQMRNQYKGSECGVYSINFIVRLLHGTKIDDILKKKVSDGSPKLWAVVKKSRFMKTNLLWMNLRMVEK